MFSIALTLLIGGYSLPTNAVPLQAISEFLGSPTLGSPTLINNSTSALNARPTIKCDARYGTDLDVLDCRNAISQLNPGSRLVPIKDRENVALGDIDTLPLPFRVMGSKLAADQM